MKERDVFSRSTGNYNQFTTKKYKFEIVKCPVKENYCLNNVEEINKYYREFESYAQIKEYQSSINALKNAFYKTTELKKLPCSKCADFFQSHIIQSLELTRNDIHRMTVGLFKTKRYNSSYARAEDTLKELKNAAIKFKELKMEQV
jgi:hypothetical protein